MTDLRALVEQAKHNFWLKHCTIPWSEAARREPEFMADLDAIAAPLLDALAGAEKEYLDEATAHAEQLSKRASAEARLSKLQELGRQVVEAVQGMARPLSPAANRALAELDGALLAEINKEGV